MTKKLIVIAMLGLLSKNAFSQEVTLFIKDIKEERRLEPENSFIELTSIVNGLKVDDLNQIKLHEITNAVDDSGNTLKEVKSFFRDTYDSSSRLTIKLEAPARKATKISSLEGTIKQFSPSEANGSKIIVTKPLDQYNKNLLRKNYKDVKLILVDKEGLQKLKEKDEEAYNKQIEQLKKEGGLGEGLAEAVDALKQFFEGFSNFGSGESLSFYIEDEKNKIVEILIYNEKGEKMNYGSIQGHKNLTINLREKAAPDWKIEILIENKNSLKTHKFKLTDIILP